MFLKISSLIHYRFIQRTIKNVLDVCSRENDNNKNQKPLNLSFYFELGGFKQGDFLFENNLKLD